MKVVNVVKKLLEMIGDAEWFFSAFNIPRNKSNTRFTDAK